MQHRIPVGIPIGVGVGHPNADDPGHRSIKASRYISLLGFNDGDIVAQNLGLADVALSERGGGTHAQGGAAAERALGDISGRLAGGLHAAIQASCGLRGEEKGREGGREGREERRKRKGKRGK